MTTITRSADAAVSTSADPVRRILRLDAAFCAAGGIALVAASGAITDRAELAAPTVPWALGLFLIVLAVDLVVFSRASDRLARFGAAVTGLGDVAWAGASIAVAFTAELPGWSTAGILAQAVAVLVVAFAKSSALRASGR